MFDFSRSQAQARRVKYLIEAVRSHQVDKHRVKRVLTLGNFSLLICHSEAVEATSYQPFGPAIVTTDFQRLVLDGAQAMKVQLWGRLLENRHT